MIDELNGPRPGEDTPIHQQAVAAAATAAAAEVAAAAAAAVAAEGNENLRTPTEVQEQTVAVATADPPPPANSTPRSEVRNPYAMTPPRPRQVHFTTRIEVFGPAPTRPPLVDPNDAMDEVEVLPTMILGDKGVLVKMLLDLVQKAIHLPSELFDKQVKLTEKSKRIKKATRKPQLDQTAERVASIVNAERPVAPATLRGLVHEETVSNTASLQREVQSLKAKMDSLLVGKEKGGNQKKKKKPSANKTHQNESSKQVSNQAKVKNRGVGSGKAGAKPATKHQVGDGAKGTTAGSKNKRPHPSKNKSSGKRAANNKKKHS